MPSTLFKKCKSVLLGRGRRNSFEANDEFWIVFDKDEHPCFLQTINNCVNSDVKAAYSNPCFEYWLLLHFRDYDASAGRTEVQKKLSKICHSYDPNRAKTCSFEELEKGIRDALKRARNGRQRREAERSVFGSPSTTVDLLVKAVCPSIDD